MAQRIHNHTARSAADLDGGRPGDGRAQVGAAGDVSAAPVPGTLPRVAEAPPEQEPVAAAERTGWRHALVAWLDRRSRRSLWLSVAVSVVVGVAYALHLGTTLHYADERSYVAIVGNLVSHGRYSLHGSSPTAYEAPGWPLLLAPVHLLGGGIVAYRMVNVVLGAVVVVLAWWLARDMGGDAVAALAAPMVALYPLAVYTAGTLYPETLASALLLAGLAAAARARRAPGVSWWAVGAGASFGYLILSVPNAWLPLAATLVWLVLGRRRLWRVAAAVLVVAVAVVSVWVVRNALAFHAFVPVTDAGGYNLLLADSEHAGVRAGVDTNIALYQAAAADQGITSELALQNFYKDEALAWMRSHPARALVLYGERVADYFAPFDKLATASQQSLFTEVVASLTYLPLLALLAVRLARWRRDTPGSFERLIIWTYLLNALVAAVFVTRVRYRLPFDELLIVVAASTVVSLLAVKPAGRHAAGRAAGRVRGGPAARREEQVASSDPGDASVLGTRV